MNERCFACDRPLNKRNLVYTSDQQLQHVGSKCFKLVKQTGIDGWQPPKGGPRLFIDKPALDLQH